MDVKQLKKIQTPTSYTNVKGRVPQEHAALATQEGISEQAIIEMAYKEVYEQLSKETTLRGILPQERVNIPVPQPKRRGEYGTPGLRTQIIELLEKNSCETGEIIDQLNADAGNVYARLSELIADGTIAHNGGRPRRYWLKSKGDPLVNELFPPGTKTEIMR